MSLETAALTPGIELAVTDLASQAGEMVGIKKKETCTQKVTKWCNHYFIGINVSLGTGGTGAAAWGYNAGQYSVSALGTVVAIVCYSTAGFIWWKIPTASLNDNVKTLNKATDQINSDAKNIQKVGAELGEAKDQISEQLDSLSSALSNKTKQLSDMGDKLEKTQQQLQKYLDLYLKYQKTTEDLTASIKSLASFNPELTARINQIALTIKEEEKEQKSMNEDVKHLVQVEVEMKPMVEQGEKYHKQFEDILAVLNSQIIPAVSAVHDERNRLAEQVKMLASEIAGFKQFGQTFADQETKASQSETALREEITVLQALVEALNKNQALKSHK